MQFPTLKSFQKEAYLSLRNNAHTILVAPTGSGKSLIFQKYLFERRKRLRTLFISPLNALARQQAQRLKALGIEVKVGVGIKGEGPPSGPGVWVINPERIRDVTSKNDPIQQWAPQLLVVDEAHCVWEWGDGFRPEFKRVLDLVERYSIQKSFWCTATLPVGAREEILSKIPESASQMGQFEFPACVEIEKLRCSHSLRVLKLKQICEQMGVASGIIFVATRFAAENLVKYFSAWEMNALIYHAGMSQEERLALEARLERAQLNQESIILIATSAFGMGMDYGFLKYCVLFEPSFNLLSLAQSLGRVGRSGEKSKAWVLWHDDDFLRYEWMTKGSFKREQELAWVKRWCESESNSSEILDIYFNCGNRLN